jgi:hypothetical protein
MSCLDCSEGSFLFSTTWVDLVLKAIRTTIYRRNSYTNFTLTTKMVSSILTIRLQTETLLQKMKTYMSVYPMHLNTDELSISTVIYRKEYLSGLISHFVVSIAKNAQKIESIN